MLIAIAIVIAVLGTIFTVCNCYDNIVYRKRMATQIREMLIVGEAYHKFIRFLVSALSEDSVDPNLRSKIFKYLLENKIDLTQAGGK